MSEKITFKELVEKISKTTDQSEQKTDSFIHELVGIIESGLQKGDKITLSGFGKFELRWMDQRKGRNPQTGEEITIPGQNKVVFQPYKALREHVNQPFKSLDAQILDETPEKGKSESQAELKNDTYTPAIHYSSGNTDKKEDYSYPRDSIDEDIDELIRERPSPVTSKIPASTGMVAKMEEPEPLSSSFTDTQSGKKYPESPANLMHERKVKPDETRATFHWSYAAVTAAVLLVIFLLFYVLFWMDDPSNPTEAEIAIQPQPEQTETPTPLSQLPATMPDEPAAISADETNAEETAELREHTVSSGQTLWTIADQEYGDPYLWPLIYHENVDLLDNPNQIAAGTALLIPEISDVENMTQPELTAVARGYLSVYDWMAEHQPDSARYFLWAVGSFSQDELQRVSDRVNETDLSFATQR